MNRFKGVSPLIATVVVIALTLGIATFVVPWGLELARNIANETGSSANYQILCQNVGYDFDTSYENSGINWSFSGENDTLEVMIINTGSVNLYNFSIEIVINTSAGMEVKEPPLNTSTQRTSGNPLKPGRNALLKANITEDYADGLKTVKVLNEVCKLVYITQDV
jgi:FlaG/FlaF family flagellin (archaellin)